jgi:hypothetical protein
MQMTDTVIQTTHQFCFVIQFCSLFFRVGFPPWLLMVASLSIRSEISILLSSGHLELPFWLLEVLCMEKLLESI